MQRPMSSGQVVLIRVLLVALSLRVGEMRVLIRPQTEIQSLDELWSYPGAFDGAGKLRVRSLKLARRQSTINGINEAGGSNPVDENGKYVGSFSKRCREALLMSPARLEKRLELDADILEGGGHTCHWEVIGTGTCVPQITCTNFTLMDPKPATGPEPPACKEEYLQLADGSVGLKRYCGKEGPEKVTSGRFLRDIYLTLKIAAHKVKNRQLQCSITCIRANETDNDESEGSKPLTEDQDEPITISTCKCGRMDVHQGEGEARRGEFPWIAALVGKSTRKPFCAASLINSNFVVTSAHCFRGGYANASNIEILLHPHELNVTRGVAKMQGVPRQLWAPDELRVKDEADHSFRFGISKYIVHPLFVRQTNDFDVALVKLDRPVDWKLMKGLSPICMPDPGQYDQSKEGAHGVVAGWALKSLAKSMKNSTSQLKSLEKQWVEVLENKECNRIYDWRFTHRMMCAGHRSMNGSGRACAADSGSGLVGVKGKSIFELFGVLAYAEGCVNQKGPGIYTDMRQVSQWIYYVCTSEEAVWCAGG